MITPVVFLPFIAPEEVGFLAVTEGAGVEVVLLTCFLGTVSFRAATGLTGGLSTLEVLGAGTSPWKEALSSSSSSESGISGVALV